MCAYPYNLSIEELETGRFLKLTQPNWTATFKYWRDSARDKTETTKGDAQVLL